MHICIYVYMFISIHVYICTCIHVYMYTCTHAYMYMCTYRKPQTLNPTHRCLHLPIFFFWADVAVCASSLYVYICISAYLYICISVYLYICISVYLYTCTYAETLHTLHTQPYRCLHLPIADVALRASSLVGTCDPYVKVMVGGTVKKTQVQMGTLYPEFDEVCVCFVW